MFSVSRPPKRSSRDGYFVLRYCFRELEQHVSSEVSISAIAVKLHSILRTGNPKFFVSVQLRTLTHTCTIICTNKMSKRARKLPPRYKDNALPLDNWTAETSKLCIYEFVSDVMIAMHAVYMHACVRIIRPAVMSSYMLRVRCMYIA